MNIKLPQGTPGDSPLAALAKVLPFLEDELDNRLHAHAPDENDYVRAAQNAAYTVRNALVDAGAWIDSVPSGRTVDRALPVSAEELMGALTDDSKMTALIEKCDEAEADPAALRMDDCAVAHAMAQYGGGFVTLIGQAVLEADGDNRARLRAAFPELWQKYRMMAGMTEGRGK